MMASVFDQRKILILFFGSFLAFFVFFPDVVFGQDSQVNVSVQANIQAWQATSTPPNPPGGGGGGGGGVVVPPSPSAKVIFIGRAYPNAIITLLRNDAVAATFLADGSGSFRREVTGIPGGNHNFGFWAQDSEGRKSVTLSFSVSILPDATTTVSGIFISPTIDVSPVQVEKGKTVDLAGQAFPESQLKIFISSKEIIKDATTSQQGKWGYKLNTLVLEEGEHHARAKALFGEGEQSSFSQTLSFLVLRKGAMICKGADLNFDNKINIVDFSILLYFWGQKTPGNACADINFDGIVSIVDFSIMMYWWTS